MQSINLRGFTTQKLLGQGTYGCVYKARRESDGQSYAVKIVNLGKLNQREIEDSVNEIRLMASFTSPFIIRFFEAFADNRHLAIVTEYARLGDLAHLIERRKKKRKPFKEEDIWRFLLQMLQGLRVLHSHGVVHRDLKSANIMLAAPDLIKIGDLGVSTVLHTTQLARTQIGTPLYLAPEVWKKRPYDQHCDMWSLGVLLYEMMTFSFPFIARTTEELSRRVCLGKYTVPRGYSSDLQSIIRRLLQVNPILRPSCDEILNLQCVKNRMYLLDDYISPEVISAENNALLSTIHVQHNVRNVNLPSAAYGVKPDIVKPLGQRIHMKKGVALRKEINSVSSPELQLICDLDWWSPNKARPIMAPQVEPEPEQAQHQPVSQRAWVKPVRAPNAPPARAPRHYQAGAAGRECRNPRFNCLPIR